MLRFRSLASGSSGNATLLEASDGLRRTHVLIDCGLGLRQLTARLAADGLTLADLDGVFITHEHGDHLGCASNLMRRHGVPAPARRAGGGVAHAGEFAGASVCGLAGTPRTAAIEPGVCTRSTSGGVGTRPAYFCADARVG